jgi:tRNA (guanine26-N2/guanine27-N2)-dimethyltransferase
MVPSIREGNVTVNLAEGVFYNPNMEFSRDISSLAISSIPERLAICDGMSASGIRGIRYIKENSNVEDITFVDMDKAAVDYVKENLQLNGVKAEVVEDDINHFLYRGGKRFNFVELDPFGSPVPFTRSALLNLRASKTGYLSVTATDTAVLCGANPKACQIYYNSRPLHNSVCHEAGIRILLSHIARIASPLRLGIEPVISLSKRHYMKVIVKVKKDAKSAFDSVKKLGFVSFCPQCFTTRTETGPFLGKICSFCGHQTDWGGPMWISNLHSSENLGRMLAENKNRAYSNRLELSRTIQLMQQEDSFPPFYFDIHAIVDRIKLSPPKFDTVIDALVSKGYSVGRTHFSVTSIKTDAPASEVVAAIKGAGKA